MATSFARILHRCLVLLLITLPALAVAADNPALWKHQTRGSFDQVVEKIKRGLSVGQFQITAEENLSKGLENNKHMFPPGKWNTIGFDNVRAIHFCSVVFNQEVFNIDLDWSVLCPFKLVAYTTRKAPQSVTVVMVRPTYLLAKDPNKKAAEVGKKIEERIIASLKEELAF
jgi:uncharacterized protein (DUF302 family)